MPDGSKELSHRHNWSATADVSSHELDGMGLVIDFRHLTATLKEIVAEFDNKALDEIDYFRRNNPSAENVAKYIYEKLGPRLPQAVKLDSVSVVEEPGCSAKFTRDS
jgi:6-pyruvoyltetrahydropterin/6-carboxytetrahydropterin synthase